MSKKYVLQSVARLERSGLIKVERSTKKHTSNRYTFKESKYFNQIPYEVLEQADLSATQIAMLVALRRFFNSNTLQLEITRMTEIAKLLGLTYKTVYTQYKSLITAGYIVETEKVLKSGIKKTVTLLSDKVNWLYERKTIKLAYVPEYQPEAIYIVI
jgi:DNA-binding MarR family transcriptional regulator